MSDTPPSHRGAGPPLSRRLQFSLRELLLATTLAGIFFAGLTAVGLVEIVDLMLLGTAGFVLWTAAASRSVGATAARGVALYAAMTFCLVYAVWLLPWPGHPSLAALLRVVAWTAMTPLSLVHHAICRWCGWHSGLAQPGTFLLLAVLNGLFWHRAYRRSTRRPPLETASPDA